MQGPQLTKLREENMNYDYATLVALVLVALGAGLMTTACLLAELWSPSGRAP